MQTLIELYDERPLENVLAAEVFRPDRVLYICPEKVASDQKIHRQLRAYFRHREQRIELIFRRAKIYDTESVLEILRGIVQQYPDCAIDIAGGTDAVLFAAGLLCAETDIPAFTYSRRSNRFFDICNAPFAADAPCNVAYSVEDCFMMAGGTMRQGRVDNALLLNYINDIEPFFRVFLRFRRSWPKIVTYMQRVSPGAADGSFSLEVHGDYTVKGERSARISAPEEALRALEHIGFLYDLQISGGEAVSFRFRDRQIRSWLRDVGSVLELYVYKACRDSGMFQDVRTSAVVDWEGDERVNAVSNELDVMCTQGVKPVFISCKTGEVKTEALNELSVLRDRFGGRMAKAAIVTAERGGSAMRNRASELGITVIDLNDLLNGRTVQRIQRLMSQSN